MDDGESTPECWFLVGSQSLYGDETLREVERQAGDVAETLGAADEVDVRIVFKRVLTEADGIRRVCLAANATDACVGVIAWMHTFSPAKAWIAGLTALDKPLLHLHTQANLSLPWDAIDMAFMNLNQAAHGDREFGYICERLGVSRKVVAGHVSMPAVRARVGAWTRAAVGWQVSRSLRIARFGDNMRDVAVTDGDRVEAQARLGWSVQAHSINDLTAQVDRADPSVVDALVDDYAQRYALAGELAAGGARHASLRDAAQIEAGLGRFLTDGGFSAFTTNFQDLGSLRQLPGISAQRLMAAGYGFGAEGDWKTAGLLRVMKAMGAKRPGGTSFMEDYTYDLGPGEPRLVGAHMLEVCPSISADRPRCEVHPLAIGDREDPVRLVFNAAPGRGIVLGILDLGDRLRLIGNEIEIEAPPRPLSRLPVATAVWRPAPDLLTSAECWITGGGPHHTVLSTAVDRESLDDWARIAGVELVWIDAETRSSAFARELSWNRAYHRIGR